MPEDIKDLHLRSETIFYFEKGDAEQIRVWPPLEQSQQVGISVRAQGHAIMMLVPGSDAAVVAEFTDRLRQLADDVDEYAQAYRIARAIEVPASVVPEPLITDLPRCTECGSEYLPDQPHEHDLLLAGGALSFPSRGEIDAALGQAVAGELAHQAVEAPNA